MTEKDYIKEELALLKIVITAIIGAMFAIIVYNIQSSGTKFIFVMAALIIISIFLVYMGRKYKKLLDELRDLHEPSDVKLVGSTTLNKFQLKYIKYLHDNKK